MIHLFNKPWNEVPTVWLDTETTGTVPGIDAAVQVALVRFEKGVPVGSVSTLLDPGREIPIPAISIHGITDAMVKGAPTIGQFFAQASTLELLGGAQPGAYQAMFDRAFVPLSVWGADWDWPWVDPLTFVRAVDRFVRGQKRHTLEAACGRRGLKIAKAHDAAADAEAAGRLFYKVVPEHTAPLMFSEEPSVGWLLREQRLVEANEAFRFWQWLSKQPPRAEAQP